MEDKQILSLMILKKNSIVNILLAEDDEDDRDFFELALINVYPNSELTTLTNGEELFRFVNSEESEEIDIIFLDINMPRKNGQECLIEIRTEKKFEHVPVIMLSTSSNPKDIEDLFILGANMYITKSYLLSHLSILKKILELHTEGKLLKPERNKFVFEPMNNL